MAQHLAEDTDRVKGRELLLTRRHAGGNSAQETKMPHHPKKVFGEMMYGSRPVLFNYQSGRFAQKVSSR
jgi:hypothetical protein